MLQRTYISRICLWLEHAFSLFTWVNMTYTCALTSSQFLTASAPTCRPVLSGSCLPRYGAAAAGTSSSSSSSSLGPWYDLGQNRNMAEDTWTRGEHCDSISSDSNNAIVLYTPPFLEPFHRSARTFHLAGREFSIKQNWADFGVAAVVWDAAIVLCEYIESETKTRHLTLEGKRVIELGAGTGLVGMVAAQLKGHLTITDRASTFKPLRDNVLLNFSPSSSPPVPSSSTSNPNSLSPEMSTLKPTSPLSVPVVKVLEWGKNLHKFSEPFDIILGADIIYIEGTFQDLLHTLLHLSNEDTLILLSCRIRYERDNRFLDMMKEKFKVEHVLHDSKRGIEIYSAKKLLSFTVTRQHLREVDVED